jgi:ribonuclease E
MPILIQSTQMAVSEKNHVSAVYAKNKLKELEISRSQYQVGNIYIGELETLLPNINAAFVKLQKLEKNGFIQLKSVLPVRLTQKNPTQTFEIKTNLIVQVVKEPTGAKGPTLTTNLAIIGDYLILLPFGEGIHISNKVHEQKEKHALKALFTLIKPLSFGLLITKEAYKMTEQELLAEFFTLKKYWSNICNKLKKSSTTTLLTKKPDFIRKSIKHFYDKTTTKISIDTNRGVWKIYNLLITGIDKRRPDKLLLEYYDKNISLIKNFYLDGTIYSTLQPRVNLTAGGYIIIEKTEALTAIDVNSGSFSQTTTSRASLLWVNCEAATEIGRQLKLRNLGGIIVVDFIDMDYQRDQMTLLNHFNNVLKKDAADPKIIQLSEIGLVELTRRRQGQNIYDLFGNNCTKCNGLGQSFKFTDVRTAFNIQCVETRPIYCER